MGRKNCGPGPSEAVAAREARRNVVRWVAGLRLRQDYTCSGYRACDCGGGHCEGAETRPAVERLGLGAETRPLKSQEGLPGGGSAPEEDPTSVVMGDSPGRDTSQDPFSGSAWADLVLVPLCV